MIKNFPENELIFEKKKGLSEDFFPLCLGEAGLIHTSWSRKKNLLSFSLHFSLYVHFFASFFFLSLFMTHSPLLFILPPDIYSALFYGETVMD